MTAKKKESNKESKGKEKKNVSPSRRKKSEASPVQRNYGEWVQTSIFDSELDPTGEGLPKGKPTRTRGFRRTPEGVGAKRVHSEAVKTAKRNRRHAAIARKKDQLERRTQRELHRQQRGEGDAID